MKTKKDEKTELNTLLEIDKFKLDSEWERQPILVHSYMDRLAIYREQYELSKDELNVVEAEVASSARENPEDFNLTKVTDKSVAEAVLLSEEYQAAKKAVVRAKLQLDRIVSIVEALEHRKEALKSLVILHGQDYFADRPRGVRT